MNFNFFFHFQAYLVLFDSKIKHAVLQDMVHISSTWIWIELGFG